MRPTRRGLLVAAVVSVLVVAGLVISPATLLERLHGVLFSPWFPAVLVGLYLIRPVLAWPISALSVLVGYRYGIAIGLPVALAGVVVTSIPTYVVARTLRTDAGWLGRMTDGSDRFFTAAGDLRGVIAARLAPTPAEAVSAAAGIARVSAGAFVVGTLVGELPWTAAAIVAGASMRELSLSVDVIDPRLVLVGLLAAAIVLAGPAYRYARRRGVPDERP